MKRGGCKFGDGKTRGCPLSKTKKGGGAVVSQLVPKFKESVPPLPWEGGGVPFTHDAYPGPWSPCGCACSLDSDLTGTHGCQVWPLKVGRLLHRMPPDPESMGASSTRQVTKPQDKLDRR